MISWKKILLPSMVKKMKMQMKPMHEIYHTLNKMGEMTYALFMLQLCCTGSIHTTSCSLEWSSLISLSRVERISSSSTRRLDFSISSMLTWLACNGAVYEENRAAEQKEMKNIKKKLLVFFHTRNLIPVKNLVHKAKDKRIITTQMNFINFF